jgi:hypothetical protein
LGEEVYRIVTFTSYENRDEVRKNLEDMQYEGGFG